MPFIVTFTITLCFIGFISFYVLTNICRENNDFGNSGT